MKFLAGLVLDGIGIVLQPLDVAFQQLVLSLQALQLIVQHLCITVLLLIGGQPVLSEDNVIANPDCQSCGSDRRYPSPAGMRLAENMHKDAGTYCAGAVCDVVTHS